jgi:ketosteroid isomerase-like protein
MNTSILKTMFLVGLMSIIGSPAWSAETTGGVEETIAALERQWLESSRANKPDLLAPLLADKFIGTFTDGTVLDKAENLAWEKATRFTSLEDSNQKVVAYGDTAIATGLIKAKGTDTSGKPFDTAWRYTDTWVKMPSGQWQCVASHSSPVAM